MMAEVKRRGRALREILEIVRAKRPNVIVQVSAGRASLHRGVVPGRRGCPFPSDPARTGKATHGADGPSLFPPETRLWWKAADVVFTVAVGKQRRLIERYGGREVRFVPNTYDHVHHRGGRGKRAADAR